VPQDYRAKFQPLISAVESVYKSLEGDEALPPTSLHIDARLKELEGEDAETLDATIAFAIREAHKRDEKAHEEAEREKEFEAFRQGKLFVPRAFSFLRNLAPSKTDFPQWKVDIRQSLWRAVSLRQRGSDGKSVKESLNADAQQFLEELRQRNPKVHSAVVESKHGIYFGPT
jgi:hypothetical protein